ncbi:hypothetical protein LTR37_014260 [Vermiconidia calcicola]|uniref:Uncharacterized protein n=1 Tax=Vermiconidia calcicola TaxID=1690605 RepID=A0ACC3MU87_9PEZI|nr:hypothetical protein LTR37_014260 [Vermiconidia calcicola]
MQYKSAAIIAAGLAAQQVVATGWTDAGSYSCPGNTDNQCSDQQQGGYDWSGLDSGSFDSYGSNTFSGFECSESYGKRDLVSKRTFQSKAIIGNLDEQPSMSCSGEDYMSIDEIEVSTSEDADVDCEYSMPDGSTCTETHSCAAGGSVVKNTQCGGAKSVTFKPGKEAPSGCSIGVHSVGFHCGGPASSSVPSYSTPTGYASSSSAFPVSSSYAVSSSASAPCYGDKCGSSSSAAPVSSSYVASSSASAPCYGDKCEGSSSSAYPVSSSYVASSSASAPCYGDKCEGSSSSAYPVSSSYVASSSSAPAPCYGDKCEGSSSSAYPVSSSKVASSSYYASSSSGYAVSSSASAPCYGDKCEGSSSKSIPAYGSSSYAAPVSSSSAPAYPTPECPSTVPKCLNTWMWISECKDNADSDCYCGNEKFITNVMGCIGSWAVSEEEKQAAASYLMGLCAPHVPENPAIITACPPTVTPTPTPTGYTTIPPPVYSSVPAPSAPASSVPSAPVYSPVSSVPASSVPAPSGYPSVPAPSVPAPSVPVSTGYTSVPVPSVPATSGIPPYSPVTSAPPAPEAPCTTITYSSVVTIPATYTEGPSAGYTVPSSSYTTELITTVTVPQVHLTTYTAGGSASVGLEAGAPSGAPAYPTGSAVGPVGYGTTFGTSFAAGPTASGYVPVQATGGAAKVGSSIVGFALAAVAAFAAL